MTAKHRGRIAYHSGLAAEASVARLYEKRGYRPARQRWRGRAGEIDLIMTDGEGIVFVEVKKSKTTAEAASHLTPRQIGRLYRSAEEYLGTLPKGLLTDARFDVALVDAVGEVTVIENALMAA